MFDSECTDSSHLMTQDHKNTEEKKLLLRYSEGPAPFSELERACPVQMFRIGR